MVERLIDRLPAVLMLAIVGLSAHVAIVETGDLVLLLSGLPAAVLLAWYLAAGRSGR